MILKYVHGPHNTIWQAMGWTPLLQTM